MRSCCGHQCAITIPVDKNFKRSFSISKRHSVMDTFLYRAVLRNEEAKMSQEVHRRRLLLIAQILSVMLMVATCALPGSSSLVHAELSGGSPAAASDLDQALIILSTLDMTSFHEAIALVQNRDGEVLHELPCHL